MKWIGFLAVFFLFSGLLLAQSEPEEEIKVHSRSSADKFYYYNAPSLLFGYNLGGSGFGELGFAMFTFGHPGLWVGKSISAEFSTGKGDFILGPKLSVWAGMGTGLGLNLIYYTDFHKGGPVFRPEVGLVVLTLKITYGYNWDFTRSAPPGINRHQVGFVWVFPLNRGK